MIIYFHYGKYQPHRVNKILWPGGMNSSDKGNIWLGMNSSDKGNISFIALQATHEVRRLRQQEAETIVSEMTSALKSERDNALSKLRQVTCFLIYT